MVSSIYWRIRYFLSNTYFKIKYRNKPDGIYYDTLTKQYVHPRLLRERTPDLFHLLCEIIQDNPVYTYTINSEEHHTHTFDELLLEAYKHGTNFSLLDKSELSGQELEMIEKARYVKKRRFTTRKR